MTNPESSTARGRSTIRWRHDLGELGPGGRHEATERIRQLVQADVRDGGDDVDLVAPLLEVGRHHLGELAGLGDVGLVEDDDAGALGQRTAAEVGVGDVGGELLLDDVEVGERVATGFEGGAVDDVGQHGAALDVPEELQAQASAQVRAGDQPGDVGDGEPHLAGRDDAEVRDEGRERVVRDLRSGRGQHGDQRRLPRRGEPDEGDVGERLQLEDDVERVPRLPEQGEPWRPPAR